MTLPSLDTTRTHLRLLVVRCDMTEAPDTWRPGGAEIIGATCIDAFPERIVPEAGLDVTDALLALVGSLVHPETRGGAASGDVLRPPLRAEGKAPYGRFEVGAYVAAPIAQDAIDCATADLVIVTNGPEIFIPGLGTIDRQEFCLHASHALCASPSKWDQRGEGVCAYSPISAQDVPSSWPDLALLLALVPEIGVHGPDPDWILKRLYSLALRLPHLMSGRRGVSSERGKRIATEISRCIARGSLAWQLAPDRPWMPSRLEVRGDLKTDIGVQTVRFPWIRDAACAIAPTLATLDSALVKAIAAGFGSGSSAKEDWARAPMSGHEQMQIGMALQDLDSRILAALPRAQVKTSLRPRHRALLSERTTS